VLLCEMILRMAGPADRTFLFADLSGFTALTEAHGDVDAADLVAEFLRSVRGLLPEHRAQLVKSIGDAAMIRCDDAADAIRLGVRIVKDIGGQHAFPVVRAGMHTGPATERDGDWFGSTVNLAARIARLADGDEVLLTAATRERAGALDGIALRERGPHALRNLTEPVLLFEAGREGDRWTGGLPIDPVCRMAVDPDDAAGTLRHGGVRYYFCSLPCVQRFAEHPDLYTSSDTGRHRIDLSAD
jgi:class 3 adenylate cyclase/YHS domain-containing protein